MQNTSQTNILGAQKGRFQLIIKKGVLVVVTQGNDVDDGRDVVKAVDPFTPLVFLATHVHHTEVLPTHVEVVLVHACRAVSVG